MMWWHVALVLIGIVANAAFTILVSSRYALFGALDPQMRHDNPVTNEDEAAELFEKGLFWSVAQACMWVVIAIAIGCTGNWGYA